MTTLRSFVDNLEALVVAGVSYRYPSGPPAAPPNILPCQYVRFPNLDEGQLVFGEGGGWPVLRATLVILEEAVPQDAQRRNFDRTVDMCDSVRAALQGCIRNTLADSKPTWRISTGVDTVGGQAYWAVVAEVEAKG